MTGKAIISPAACVKDIDALKHRSADLIDRLATTCAHHITASVPGL
ncbi:hypothetical protein [uncultured Roseobacter sp.]|nr:hypothetical protein [uncultured Roseobacter sp.]